MLAFLSFSICGRIKTTVRVNDTTTSSSWENLRRSSLRDFRNSRVHPTCTHTYISKFHEHVSKHRMVILVACLLHFQPDRLMKTRQDLSPPALDSLSVHTAFLVILLVAEVASRPLILMHNKSHQSQIIHIAVLNPAEISPMKGWPQGPDTTKIQGHFVGNHFQASSHFVACTNLKGLKGHFRLHFVGSLPALCHIVLVRVIGYLEMQFENLAGLGPFIL